MKSITEELRYRQRAVEYAIKHNNNTEAARRYPKSKYKKLEASYPGQYVQLDIKYVPMECFLDDI